MIINVNNSKPDSFKQRLLDIASNKGRTVHERLTDIAAEIDDEFLEELFEWAISVNQDPWGLP